jgi:DNA-binding CsgD family transcriptional regulator
VNGVRLIDRDAEREALDRLLDDIRRGAGRGLVLVGEPGAGKSALLDYAVSRAADMEVVRVGAVESEQHLGFSAVHQLLSPLLPAVDGLPGPQRNALAVAFGLEPGSPADPFLIGLAVLTLLSDAGHGRPVLCVVDDAQWLDEESRDALSIVARRLLADPVGLLFGVRDGPDVSSSLAGLPELRLSGMSDEAASELVAETVGQPIDPLVSAQLVTETGGNPLAVVEAARQLSAAQRKGTAPLPQPLPVGGRLEASYVRRVKELPADTQSLLLLAAAASPGQDDVLWRAAAQLDIPEEASSPAEAAGLLSLEPDVRFPQPLVRSAIYHGATPEQRRQVHRALAAASDLDLVARAWHLASATARRDEAVAVDLEAAADLVRRRGGYAATAQLLERAAQLTPSAERRAERQLAAARVHVLAGTIERASDLLDEATPVLNTSASRAEAQRLRGMIEATCGQVAAAAEDLLAAARQLAPHNPSVATDTLLAALENTVFAGWQSCAPLLGQIAGVAAELKSTGPPEAASAPALLLQAYTARITSGYAVSVPEAREAVLAFEQVGDYTDPVIRRLELAAISAVDLLDESAVERLTKTWVDLSRRKGALARLAGGLAFRSAFVHAPFGQLSAAWTAEAEARELGEITHNPAVVPPTGAHRLLTLAMSGQEHATRETAAAVAREAPERGAAGEAALATYALGVLEISLGNYDAAVGCLTPAFTDGTPLIGTPVLPELVEAAARSGRLELAAQALARLAERSTASATSLAHGLLARSDALLRDADQAQDGYREALHVLADARSVPQLARTHLLYGEWLRRRRLRGDARDQLHRALEMFEAMGLEAFAERCRGELRSTGERIRRTAPGDPQLLTPREAQIANLVSEGASNREIAAQLFVTASTVEYHLRNVFRKLGVTSRTQLAHRVSSEGLPAGEPAYPLPED